MGRPRCRLSTRTEPERTPFSRVPVRPRNWARKIDTTLCSTLMLAVEWTPSMFQVPVVGIEAGVVVLMGLLGQVVDDASIYVRDNRRRLSADMADTPKVAIITGASHGIGAGLASAFRGAGYAVV